jgi:hypothetical protein
MDSNLSLSRFNHHWRRLVLLGALAGSGLAQAATSGSLMIQTHKAPVPAPVKIAKAVAGDFNSAQGPGQGPIGPEPVVTCSLHRRTSEPR